MNIGAVGCGKRANCVVKQAACMKAPLPRDLARQQVAELGT